MSKYNIDLLFSLKKKQLLSAKEQERYRLQKLLFLILRMFLVFSLTQINTNDWEGKTNEIFTRVIDGKIE